jgi:hypothetical protein
MTSKYQGKSRRLRERLELKLPVRVHCRETPDFEWTEVTRLLDVTPFGARFTLKRPTERGRLLHMTIPMPRPLRVFDHVEDQYRVWALVRHVEAAVSPENKTTPCFHVGVAFVGKRPPNSYEEEPARRYEIAGPLADGGSIALQEKPEENGKPVQFSDQRAYTRHNIPVGMALETFNEKGEVARAESTVTENISRKGATVFSTLDVPVGRFIRLTGPQYNLTVHAVVRARSKGAGGMPRMHVEFIDREWPLD